jgi:hypothetical protein
LTPEAIKPNKLKALYETEEDIPFYYIDHILHGSSPSCDMKVPDRKAFIRYFLENFTPIFRLRNVLNFFIRFPKMIKSAAFYEMGPLSSPGEASH